jgi:menaquinone-dependent protoporphyrinogen IX oxidase
MSHILVIYTTLRGRTGEMVAPICVGIHDEGMEARARAVEEVTWEEMQAADGIVVGNPTRFGGVDWQIKRLFDVVAIQGYPGPLTGKSVACLPQGAGLGAVLNLP